VTDEVSITYLTPERFRTTPQAGIPITQEWHSFVRWLTWPSFADDKRAEGAWCPCALAEGRVKDGSGPVGLLVADVDECGRGDFERSVALCAAYAGAVVHTFSATDEQPKHRIAVQLDRALTPDEFPIAWRKFARRLEARGVVLDRGCKNINRLYFACVARTPEAWLGARILAGKPLPVDSMLAIGRAEEAAEERAREAARAHAAAAPREPGPRRTRYIEAAIDRERANVSNASAGGRHDALLRAAYALARFDLAEDELEAALLGPFVAVAGEARRREGQRAIRDAAAARVMP
jgi:hypothetical protein